MINELILTLPRTGSTYLGWSIYYHKYGIHRPTMIEHFHFPSDLHDSVKLQYYQTQIDLLDNSIVPVLKLHNFHINELKKYQLYEKLLEKMSDSTVYLLLRRNVFDLTLSHAIAEKTDQWKFYNYMPDKIYIEINRFTELMTSKINESTEIFEKAKEFDTHKILYYEDFTYNTQTDFESLDAGPCKFTGKEIPYNKAPSYNNIVKNYQELQDVTYRYVADCNSLLINSATLEIQTKLY